MLKYNEASVVKPRFELGICKSKKVKLSLCLGNHQAMKMYGEVEV
jgi:hypothetical protein